MLSKPQIREIDNWTVNSSWGTVAGAPQYVNNVEVKKAYVVPMDDIKQFKEDIKDIVISGKIEDGDKVMFDKEVTFPRKRFKEEYPTNKMVYDIKDADVLILDGKKIKSEFAWFSSTSMVPIAGNMWRNKSIYQYGHKPNHVPEPPAIGPVEEFHVIGGSGWGASGMNFTKRAEYFIDAINSNLKIVDVNTIESRSEQDFDAEAYERIKLMFQAKDDDMKNMAMRMLTAYNYDKNNLKMALLMNSVWYEWNICRNKKLNVEIKTFLNRLNSDYPTWQYSDGMPKLQFVLGIILKHDDLDPEIRKSLVNDLKQKIGGTLPDFNIIKA